VGRLIFFTKRVIDQRSTASNPISNPGVLLNQQRCAPHLPTDGGESTKEGECGAVNRTPGNSMV